MTSVSVVDAAHITAMADALSVPDGGFSVNPNDGSDVGSGYAVSVHPEHERVFNRPVTSNDLRAYMADAASALALPGRVLGGWRDPNTSRVYLDVSVVTEDFSDAVRLAEEAGQIAVFDFSAMSSVPVASSA